MIRELLVVSYNVLADAYINPDFYPHSPREALEPFARLPRLVQRIVDLGADVLCLQEVEERALEVLEPRLAMGRYAGYWTQKGRGRPDGCALFVRAPAVLIARQELRYGDGSGHIAQIARLDIGRLPVVVANTHLKWTPPGAPPADRWADRQVAELLSVLVTEPRAIVCGDFNVEPGSTPHAALVAAGFVDAHPAALPTCNPHQQAKKVDFVLARGAARLEPRGMPSLQDTTPMPSPSEPSDHLPLGAAIAFEAES